MFIIFDSVEQVNVKFVGEINVMFHIEHLNFGPQTFKANFSGRRGRVGVQVQAPLPVLICMNHDLD